MLPAVRDNIKVDGNLDGQKIMMGFDQNSFVHLMSILTDLYSNPQLAVVREISTNAWDSHVAASQTRPIEVTTPIPLSHFFKVKDYGLGLNLEDIETVFSLYGASTKRETNDQTGTLGLGCKSPLTYSNSFTVTGIKDGVKTQVSVSREEDGSGVMEIVDTVETDEPNGVEIVIPAKKYESFLNDCQRLFQYWPEGSVLLNGQEPPKFDGKEISENIYLGNEDVVVMGNVPYPVKSSAMGYKNYNIVAFVPMGSVNFVPSREELQYTPHTERTLKDIAERANEGLKKSVAADIASATSPAEALKTYYDWYNQGASFTITEFEYNGESLPGRFESTDCIVWTPNNYRYTTSKPQYMDWSTFSRGVLIKNYDLKELAPYNKTRLRKYLDNTTEGAPYRHLRHFIFCNEPIGQPWTDEVPMLDWVDIKAFKLPKPPKAAAAAKVKVAHDPYMLLDGSYVAKLDSTKPIVYVGPRDYRDTFSFDCRGWTDEQVVVLGRNRWKKFLRDYPTAIYIKEYITAKFDECNDLLTEGDRYMISSKSYNDEVVLPSLDASRIDDPYLSECIEYMTGQKSDRAVQWESWAWLMSQVGQYKQRPTMKSPLENYPLANNSYIEDTTMYINCKYNKEKSE